MSSILPPLPSPGVGARRKAPKSLPRLQVSPGPNSAASENFPLAPSPSTVYPKQIIDGHVAVGGGEDFKQWLSGVTLGDKLSGVVVALSDKDVATSQKKIAELQSLSSNVPIIGASVSVDLSNGVPDAVKDISTTSKPRITLSTTFTQGTQNGINALAWALAQGRVVDIDFQASVASGEAGWEALEDYVDKASQTEDGQRKGSILLSNILPPPHSLSLPIVKLLTDPSYLAYQGHIASLSLYSHVYLKFMPPSWGEPTPEATSKDLSKEAKEWKRRIKMYLGPAVEAFGYQRIIFGTSPSATSNASSNAGYWYELARLSLAELGVEQEDIDAVFSDNAKTVYGA